jgi:STE24 endopeptidase
MAEPAKRYSNTKYALSILDTVFFLAFLFVFLGLGFSKFFAERFSFPLYLLVVSLIYYLINFPLNFYQHYTLEHKYSLSNQTIPQWLLDQLKSGILSYIIGIILVSAFYLILKYYPATWWLVISAFWIFFSLVLAKLVPILIIPLFFKYQKLSDEVLRQRIIALAGKMKVKILDCFEIDFSKKTLKANAAFVGMGNTKRVILADTLKDKYSHDEIEVILAHEFSHYRLRHLLTLILVNSLFTIVCFYLIFKTSDYALVVFNLSFLSDVASLPLVFIYFVLFGLVTQPFTNLISRKLEKDADKMALEVTGLKDAFVSMMEKLSSQNLADRKPHPIIKIFFFDHPPVDERINMAKSV